MNVFSRTIQIRWADLDRNFHLRHSVYYDGGAFCRLDFLNEHGLTPEVMQQLQFGFILFREECVFRKEVRLGDHVHITAQLIKARKDYSRLSIQHHILKNEDTLAAVIIVEGAWMHLHHRKLTTPPEQVFHVFEQMPKADSFEWLS